MTATQTASTFTPSVFQADIFKWMETGTLPTGEFAQAVIVDAVPGSGKTTTIVHGLKYVPTSDCLFVAFNRDIAETLKAKVEGKANCMTFHSLGNSAIRAYLQKMGVKVQKPDGWKYDNILEGYLREIFNPKTERNKLIPVKIFTKKLLDLCRATLTNPSDKDAMLEMVEHFALDYDDAVEFMSLDDILALNSRAIVEGSESAKSVGSIDFGDMVYLPILWNLRLPQYSFVAVDECQDLTANQIELIKRCIASSGRFMAVGDPYQSLYGFAGASADSFYKVKEAFDCATLPLSVCYRCPKEVVKLASYINPSIQSHENAIDGIVAKVKESEVFSLLSQGDAVLCRSTAPLVNLCIRLISRGVPARVKGKSIGKDLTSLLDKIQNGVKTLDEFYDRLEAYHRKEFEKLSKNDRNQPKLDRLQDQIDCLMTVYDSGNFNSSEEMKLHIESLFSDSSIAITLSTGHRSKGLEFDRVFILKPEKMPLVWKEQLDWQFQQEVNVKFVALTRAKKELYLIETEQKD